ncbi:hypothetical protein [Dysgonomonas sp. 25]|uniref:hypothetical protein n=1 Tax=Dysgonomonas sp. 25 TaxID=2302933 RepID=UPI0013D8331D|nr:hypothetical protein [Dysgonomonas sp. 25]NDV69167.1 hypothetical protein [Dysgonomonas sp. 25]
MKTIIYILLFAVIALQASCSGKEEPEMHTKLHYIITGDEKDDAFLSLLLRYLKFFIIEH